MSFLYATDKKTPQYKIAIAGILIVASLMMFTPKKSDAIIIGLIGIIAGAGVASFIADLIIYCALGIICGGGSGGGGTTPGGGCVGASCGPSCVPQMGSACAVRNSCGTVGPTDGVIDCAGICNNATIANEYTGGSCTSPANLCGMTNTGNLHCTNGSCNATKPADSLCTGQPFGDVVPGNPDSNGLFITPAVVRTGDSITIQWDLGTNYPPNCTLVGPRLSATNTYVFKANEGTGSRTITNVTSPYQYKLTCGTNSVTRNVYILPVITET